MRKTNITRSKKTSLGIFIAIGAFLLTKIKYVLIVFKFLKLQTLVSMFIYLGTYALFFGWKFAVALVYLLFVHEMGHLYAAKKIKLPVSPALFIPFVGAVIGLKEMPKNAKDEGFVAYMGPFFGLLSFLPAIPLYYFTHEPFWALLIILGAMINLFNLIPITPLDGGRIAAGISTKLWGVGIIILLAFSIMNHSPIGFLIVILGGTEWYKLYKKQKSLHNDKMEVQELEQLVVKLKNGSNDLNSVQEITDKAKQEVTNQEITKILNTLNTEIEKMKKDIYLQQLSGTLVLNEEHLHPNQQVIERTLNNLEEKLLDYKKEIQTTESYYKTNKKTKIQLLLIYIGLIIALATSYYYSQEILMNYPEIQL
ncbi:site-2 protease family protein [Heyndrickxia oleronia]|uniref:site-2 protease family protein n=1 Tax=Heyndrickxia oleronia TaxID=38875 RepID=UPI001C0EDF86|nr:site-2 protease family protein [Heyndrickxia oleronia]MBU5213823.1 site-2 protease family protein [Heyndrickxia oleronia]